MFTILLKNWLSSKDLKFPKLYLVGGTVRDLLLNASPKDVDLVCKGAKEFAADLARSKNAALVPMEKKPDEPCYRVVDKDNRDDFLDIAEMRGETIYIDLHQRDFTIDAIAIEVKQDGTAGSVIDPLNGTEDIERKIIRMVSAKSIVSDPLRILRAVRLAASLNFIIDEATLNEMKNAATLLKDVSAERITSEFMLILKASQSVHYFRLMDSLGILQVIFPEIAAMKECAQDGFHHLNVWEHSLLVMENIENIIKDPVYYFGDVGSKVTDCLGSNNRLALLKLSALLHDVGKPATGNLHPEKERITFYRHDEEGAKTVDLIAERLKMSGPHRNLIILLVAEHLHALNIVFCDVRPSTVMRWFRKMRDDAVSAIILGMADVLGSRGPDSTEEYRSNFINRSRQCVTDYYEKIKAQIERQDLVSGKDLIALGMKPGPEMGRVLAELRSAQDTGSVKSRLEALELAKKLLE